ncbi:30S ribosomal protein S6 [Sedimentisphaera cyanobacteriorum]|uniref:Small ribosomal subunit protein bS6 n=1 Tax=Sedimentisphaera cyanobacteriorum TaxID=1940790 RepID=A0A1Q2HMD4_9BACT|nr:30S ribosomal protein S6 [Sedimentisphaera cyanobacteriorum]AQQ08627.1 30S ribosomal protein S6 [Sedimentisphaera cyanobacteriorum]
MDTAKRLYEALFLVDPALAAGDWTGLVEKITALVEKRSGEIVSLKKWDERKLAYEIQNKSRGTYILVYFNVEPRELSNVERDINLSEDIMRAMVLRADFIDPSKPIDKETPLEAEERVKREQEAKQEIESSAAGSAASVSEESAEKQEAQEPESEPEKADEPSE